MSELSQWELRRRGTDKIATASADKLAEFVHTGVIGDQHEVRVVGASEWLSVAQAMPFLPKQTANVNPPMESKRATTPPPTTPQPKTTRAPKAAPPLSPNPTSSRWLTDSNAPTSAAADTPEVSTPAVNSPVVSTLGSVATEVPTQPPSRGERAAARRSSIVDPDDEELDMTPMIDMTFLLLIFFMVTSTISPFADLQLPEAKAGDAERPEGRVILVLDYQDNQIVDDTSQYSGSEFIELKDCKLYLADETDSFIPPDQLHAALVRAFEKNGGGEFILQSNRKMPVGVVREVIKTAKSAGAGDTMIGVARPR
ncbi:ExbD/TolR family protein [Stieleria varia]|uniref:Biopolymer transport protein ExbD/TolR n=1 Tax=Stieleria varia TaxID=2528005 RepID=A0A5C6B1D0_9BACT|nr:biopolymer transporter ExbD [Stieleria varia]TWU05617.1 Biopolymer transport protein ExbD/TolR [Stieleria varia]